MAFERWTGWRYLHGERRDRIMRHFALTSLAIAIAGGVLIATEASAGLGVLLVVFGMIAAALFALLSVFSIFTSMSTFGVALGVAALTIVLGVTTGFQRAFESKVLGVNAHVIVRARSGMLPNYREVVDEARRIDRGVVGVQPFIYHELLVTRGKGEVSGIAFKGIELPPPGTPHPVLDLDRHMEQGSVAALAPKPGELPRVLLGRELAAKLGAQLGDPVTVVLPFAGSRHAKLTEPKSRKFVVAGIFHCGFDEYDRRLVYTSLAEAQALVGEGDVVFGVELVLDEVDRAGDVAAALQERLGDTYEVLDWREMNSSLFTALAVQKLVLITILTLIIIVAAVNMVASLQMMVTDKTREIAILRSLGAKTRSVSRIFQLMGVTIGGIGTALGVAIGLVTCHVVIAYGYRLDPRVYLIDRLPIELRPLEVVAVTGVSLAISWLATLVPARTAASLTPVRGLRYD